MRIHLTERKFDIIDRMVDLLNEATLNDIYQKYYSDIDKDTFQELISADPTYNPQKPQKMGKFGKWIISRYKQNKLKREDLYRIRDVLSAFVRYNNRLEVKDINKYPNEQSVYQAVRGFMEDPSQAASKSEEIRNLKHNEAKHVYEDDEWLVVVPLTEKASCYYGKGTRWCTAADNSHNMFNRYNEDGPLYINIRKSDGAKFQFHFETLSFMDAEDEEIMPYEIGLSQGLKEFYKSKASESTFMEYFYSWKEKTMIFNQELANGKAPQDIFDMTEVFSPSLTLVGYDTMWNLIGTENQLVSDMWFDYICVNTKGPSRVSKDDKWNLIDQYGDIMCDQWFDYISTFYNKDCAKVELNGKFNAINKRGQLISDIWFDKLYSLSLDEYMFVTLGDKRMYMNAQGDLYDEEKFSPYRNESMNHNNKLIHLRENQYSLLESNENSLLTETTLDDIYRKYYSNISKETFGKLINTDPTYNPQQPQKMGKYTKWIIDKYRRNLLKLEDLYRLKECLETFHRYQNRLEVKDINRYRDEQALYQAVKGFMEDPTQATSKSDEIRHIKEDEAEHVYEDDKWTVIVPLTERASCYYGKGTRWCTAADNGNNMFDSYNDDGYLYINIRKIDGAKFQFHFESEQFMDAMDREIIPREIGLTQGLKKFYAQNANNQKAFLKNFPYEDEVFEYAIECIKTNGKGNLEELFDSVEPIYNDKYIVSIGHDYEDDVQYNVIDLNGIDINTALGEGYKHVLFEDGYRYIDMSGDVLIAYEDDEEGNFFDLSSNQWLFEDNFINMCPLEKNFFIVETNEGCNIFDTDRKKLLFKG